MAANRQDVNGWIQRAINNKCQYIISVCDTYDWDDYPVFCENKEQVLICKELTKSLELMMMVQ
jgi:hypothetical protein